MAMNYRRYSEIRKFNWICSRRFCGQFCFSSALSVQQVYNGHCSTYKYTSRRLSKHTPGLPPFPKAARLSSGLKTNFFHLVVGQLNCHHKSLTWSEPKETLASNQSQYIFYNMSGKCMGMRREEGF